MVRLVGDAMNHWYQTMDGVYLVKSNGAFYVAEIDASGELQSSGIMAHNIDSRPDAEVQMAKRQLWRDNIANRAKAMKASGYPEKNFCPHKGKVRVPIIMMEFPDKKFKYSKEDFEEYFNGTEVRPYDRQDNLMLKGHSSVRQYFLDASNGQLDFEFVLYGPYEARSNHDSYPIKKGSSQGLSPSMINEVMTQQAPNIDFTQFDSNGDKRVDLIYILYAGHGQNISADETDIWPYCTWGQGYRVNGLSADIIGLSNELVSNPWDITEDIRAGIGVLCHEMSHGMGMPDLYWTSPNPPYDKVHDLEDWNNCGPEDWDLMDGGENICRGLWPVQYSAWEKEAMGWLNFEELTDAADVTIYPLDDEEGRGKAYVLKNPANENEYYVIENFMSSRNSWNYYLWAHQFGLNYNEPGLIVTHVNGYSTTAQDMSPNNTYGKPRITLLPADGFIMGLYAIGTTCWYKGAKTEITANMFIDEGRGDPYPGGNNVTEITDYREYAKSDMGKNCPITDITVNTDRSISFKFKGGSPACITDIIENRTDDKIYSLNGICLGNDTQNLPHGIYIKNGKKLLVK